MDTLIYIPFSLWGFSPFISKNLNYELQRPKIKDIEIYKSYDYGLILRKEVLKSDSLPISTIYSIQFPNDNYSQYGVGFSRYIKNFLISLNYDYNNDFKQGSFAFDYKFFDFSYFEIFKLNNHLQFFYIGISNFLKLNYQIYNNDSLFFSQILYSKFIYSNNQREVYINHGISKKLLKIYGGFYYNFIKEFSDFNYDLMLDFDFLKITSIIKPFQFEDSIYKFQKHFLELNYKFIKLSYSCNKNLVPIDTTNFSFSYFNSISISISNKFFSFSAIRNIKIPIEWIINLNAFYEFYLRKDILIKPYVSAFYIENEFEESIEDIFISRLGISFNLFNGLFFDLNYTSNLFVQSLWNYNSYGLFLRMSLED